MKLLYNCTSSHLQCQHPSSSPAALSRSQLLPSHMLLPYLLLFPSPRKNGSSGTSRAPVFALPSSLRLLPLRPRSALLCKGSPPSQAESCIRMSRAEPGARPRRAFASSLRAHLQLGLRLCLLLRSPHRRHLEQRVQALQPRHLQPLLPRNPYLHPKPPSACVLPTPETNSLGSPRWPRAPSAAPLPNPATSRACLPCSARSKEGSSPRRRRRVSVAKDVREREEPFRRSRACSLRGGGGVRGRETCASCLFHLRGRRMGSCWR